MDNIIVKITAESDMSDATKDFDSLKQKETELLSSMEALKKKQAEFQGAPKVISLLANEYKKLEKDLKTTQTTMSGFANQQKKVNDSVIAGATSSKSLRTQIAAMREELSRMEMAGDMTSKTYINLSVQAGKMQDQMGDTRQTIQHLSSDTRGLDTAMGLGRGLAGGFSAATSAAALLGGENEELTAAFLKVQAAMAILNGVQEVALVLNKNSAVMVNIRTTLENSNTISKIKNAVATRLQTTNTILETAANNGSKVAKIGATVTQWALNAAVYAFPAVAIIAALAAIGGGLYLWSKNSEKTRIEQDALNKSMEDFVTQTAATKDQLDYELELMVAQGKSKDEIRAKEKEGRKNAFDDADKELKDATRKRFAFLAGNSEVEVTKEQIDKLKALRISADDDLTEMYRDWKKEDAKLKADAATKDKDNNKKSDEEKKKNQEEYNKYILDISKQLEDSKITVMKDGFAKQEAQITLEFNRKIALIKGNSAKEIELRASLEREKQQKISAASGAVALKGEKLTGDGVLKIFEKTQEKKSDILTSAENKLSKSIDNTLENSAEKTKKEADDYKTYQAEKQEVTMASMQAVGEIGNLLFEAGAEKRQIEMDDLDREYSAKIEAAEGNASLQKRLEDELAAKKLDIRIKQAKADKAQAIFNIGLSTAQAIISALAMVPPNVPLSIIAGITGAAQLAAVLAKPLPKYAKGKKAGGGGHFATVGELGAETMWIPDNAAVIPHNRQMNFDTFKDFGIPFEMDSKLMRGAEIDYDKLGASVGKHVRIPTPKPVTVNVDKSGVSIDYSGNKTTFLNKKYQGSWN